MKRYKRIEITAFRRRVTIVSGEWPIVDIDDLEPAQTDDDISLNDADTCEPVAPDSPEGQVILVEAVRSLESRLSPETRAAMSITPDALAPNFANQSAFCRKLQSFYQLICPKALRFTRKEK